MEIHPANSHLCPSDVKDFYGKSYMWVFVFSLQVTDELLEKIASRSQNITEINISDCRNVSDTGVCILAIKCPGLLRYTAYRCKQLSDTSIIAVASQCPLLQKVHVGNQDRLTDEGLKQVNIHSTDSLWNLSIFQLSKKKNIAFHCI